MMHLKANLRSKAFKLTVLATIAWATTATFADASALRQGIAAFSHEDYNRSARIFIPLAAAGDPVAQAYLGFQFETGRGVPMNYSEAAMWYRRSAEQGYDPAQFALGLLYNKGHGVPRNIAESGKWLNLAAAAAPKHERERRARMRDVVTTKMTRGEVALSRARALEWIPTPER